MYERSAWWRYYSFDHKRFSSNRWIRRASGRELVTTNLRTIQHAVWSSSQQSRCGPPLTTLGTRPGHVFLIRSTDWTLLYRRHLWCQHAYIRIYVCHWWCWCSLFSYRTPSSLLLRSFGLALLVDSRCSTDESCCWSEGE